MRIDIDLKKISKGGGMEHIISKALDFEKEKPEEIFVRILEQFRPYRIEDQSIDNLKSIEFLSLSMMPVRDAHSPKGVAASMIPEEYFHIDVMDQMVDYIEKNI